MELIARLIEGVRKCKHRCFE